MSKFSTSPMITTIIPTHRRPKLLKRAICSVLNQTYPHFQVCVYDNASGDETAAIVEEIARSDSRVEYHCHAENIGAIRNFNYGAERVETPFFSFLSDDDVLLPGFYENAMDSFERFPDAACFTGEVVITDYRGKILKVSRYLLWEREGYYAPPDGFFEMLEKGRSAWTSSVFRKEVLKKVGAPLDKDVGSTDSYFAYRVAAHFPFVLSREPCAIFVYQPSSITITSGRNLDHVWPGWLNMIRKLNEDERLPLHVRIRAERKLTQMLQRIIFGSGISAFKQRNFEDVHRAANILHKHYNLRRKAAILYTAAKLCQLIPPAYYLPVCLNKIRRVFRPAKYSQGNLRHLREQFGDYARYMK